MKRPNYYEWTITQHDVVEAIKEMKDVPDVIDKNMPSARCGPYIVYYHGVNDDVISYDMQKKEWLWV